MRAGRGPRTARRTSRRSPCGEGGKGSQSCGGCHTRRRRRRDRARCATTDPRPEPLRPARGSSTRPRGPPPAEPARPLRELGSRAERHPSRALPPPPAGSDACGRGRGRGGRCVSAASSSSGALAAGLARGPTSPLATAPLHLGGRAAGTRPRSETAPPGHPPRRPCSPHGCAPTDVPGGSFPPALAAQQVSRPRRPRPERLPRSPECAAARGGAHPGVRGRAFGARVLPPRCLRDAEPAEHAEAGRCLPACGADRRRGRGGAGTGAARRLSGSPGPWELTGSDPTESLTLSGPRSYRGGDSLFAAS